MALSGFQIAELMGFLDDKQATAYKKYFAYDGSGNVTDIYMAQAAAINGEACIRLRLAYTTAGGNSVVQKMVYASSTWNSAWDI